MENGHGILQVKRRVFRPIIMAMVREVNHGCHGSGFYGFILLHESVMETLDLLRKQDIGMIITESVHEKEVFI